MTASDASENAQQIAYWNGRAGESWTDLQDAMDRSLSEVTKRLVAGMGVGPGERVLDVGCGCGETTLLVSDAVGTRGSVTGVDVSAPMLAHAQRRAASRVNAHFRCEDAANADLGGPYDLVTSRFGVMFFADPVAAFTNIARAMRPGGRLVFACWQDLRECDWFTVPMRVVKPLLEAPPAFPPPDPDAPGPSAFARRERVESVLSAAGFRDISLEPHDVRISLGADAEHALGQLLRIGPVARALAEESTAVRERAKAALRTALTELETEGRLALGASFWLVRATH